jgi:hypothetical protein
MTPARPVREETRRNDDRREERIVKSATEARQGEIILGTRGVWIWIAALVVIVALAIVAV